MKLLRGFCCLGLLLGIALLTSASSIIPHQTDEESLKSALDAVTRKQRSLDFMPRDYYNDLRNFKYHPNDDNDEKFARQQNQNLDDEDEDLEFLPLENGQLENIGGGYQNFNNKRLERALLDYFENSSGQRESSPSSFRERERTGGHKRGLTKDHLTSNEPDKDLAALFYKELQNGPSYTGNMAGEAENEDYLFSDTLQSYYEKYRAEQARLDRNKIYEANSGPMSWGEIVGKQESSRNRNNKFEENGRNEDDGDDDDDSATDGDSMYLLPAERRNVNGRYPIGREYGLLLKRYQLTKRSPKPLHREKEPADGVITDPKVAKDLGALFGSQKMADKTNNHTFDKNQHIEQNDNQDHDHTTHNHDHNHDDHDHDRVHDHSPHDHDKHLTSTTRDHVATSSEAPKSSINSPKDMPGQKEITNNGSNNKAAKLLSKRDQRHIELRKKSVDWSEYFGIDRRKKKAAFLAQPGSQDQDDEWMLQRYYKTMAENLKSAEKDTQPDKDNGEKRDKLDQMDTHLRNVKNLIVEDALKYGNDENSDPQEVKDVVMARLAAAYSLEKMQRALNEFRKNIAAQRDLMRTAHDKNNGTNNFRQESHENKNFNENKKRNGNRIDLEDGMNPYEGRNLEGFDEGRGCPELDSIERSCRPANGLYEPCVMHKICRACDNEEECSNIFASEAAKVCESIPDSRESRNARGHCARTALAIWQIEPSPIATALCHSTADSCLKRHYRYRHRALYYQNGWLPHVALDSSQQLRER